MRLRDGGGGLVLDEVLATYGSTSCHRGWDPTRHQVLRDSFVTTFIFLKLYEI